MNIDHPRYIIWSTDQVDLSDPFIRKWYLRQVLLHGLEKDISALDLDEVEDILKELSLPANIYNLWKRFLEARHAAG